MTASTTTPARPTKAVKERRPLRSHWLGVWSTLVYVWLFAPIVVVVAFSFNDPAGKFNTSWNEFTFDNWLNPFAKQDYTDAFIVSLKVAAVSCIIATILGGLMALAISRYEFRGKGFVNIILVLPLTTPEIVMGSSLFTLFFARDLDFGFPTVVIAHILFCLSFVALTIEARVRGFDWSLEDAALDLGSSPLRTFWTITCLAVWAAILPKDSSGFSSISISSPSRASGLKRRASSTCTSSARFLGVLTTICLETTLTVFLSRSKTTRTLVFEPYCFL